MCDMKPGHINCESTFYPNKLSLWQFFSSSTNGWDCSFWVDMKWSDLFRQKEALITASCGRTALFPPTREEWLMRHRIKIDCVHRPLYKYLMKLIFQCTLALFHKKSQILNKTSIVFYFFVCFLVEGALGWGRQEIKGLIKSVQPKG